MGKRISFLYGGLAVGFLIPLILTYQNVFIQKDYFADLAAECDPAVSSCFIYECNWDESDCFRDMEDGDIAYYSIVHIKVKDIPCNVSYDESCSVSCNGLSEDECAQIFCEEDEETECATAEDLMIEELEAEGLDEEVQEEVDEGGEDEIEEL